MRTACGNSPPCSSSGAEPGARSRTGASRFRATSGSASSPSWRSWATRSSVWVDETHPSKNRRVGPRRSSMTKANEARYADYVAATQRDDESVTSTDLIAAYQQGIDDLRAAVAGMTAEQVLARPIPGKWSTLEVVAHLADTEIYYTD